METPGAKEDVPIQKDQARRGRSKVPHHPELYPIRRFHG